ncbi:MAG: hemolysin III family protein [Lachnospiraceae bacterium]|nr:hemolysin III family protein [Lachnospiraceae bacterium]
MTCIVGSVIFGSSLVLLYAVSAIYHGLPQDTYIKKVFQVIDHCTIFLLIAGSYTAFVMGTLYWAEPLPAIWMLIIIWTTAIVGIVLNAIDLKKYAVFSMCCYLLMGWLIILKAKVLAGLMGSAALSMLVIGGVLYTVGAVFYVIGRKKRYRHFVFHIFTLLGSLAHIICAGMCVV